MFGPGEIGPPRRKDPNMCLLILREIYRSKHDANILCLCANNISKPSTRAHKLVWKSTVNRHSELGANFIWNLSFFWPTFLILRKKTNFTGCAVILQCFNFVLWTIQLASIKFTHQVTLGHTFYIPIITNNTVGTQNFVVKSTLYLEFQNTGVLISP